MPSTTLCGLADRLVLLTITRGAQGGKSLVELIGASGAATVSVPFGRCHVFELAAPPPRSCLVVEVDPVALGSRLGGQGITSGKGGMPIGTVLGAAIVGGLGPAVVGRPESKMRDGPPALVEALVIPPDTGLARKLFGPLGYDVTTEPVSPDGHGRLLLDGAASTSEILSHLAVLLPVLDAGPTPLPAHVVDLMLAMSADWLDAHPVGDDIRDHYRLIPQSKDGVTPPRSRSDMVTVMVPGAGPTGQVAVPRDSYEAALVGLEGEASSDWLFHVPPTMTPGVSSTEDGYLEHPTAVMDHYEAVGVREVKWQKKHTGHRAIVVVTSDGAAARRRFGPGASEEEGAVLTRTGERFFDDPEFESSLLARVRAAATSSGLWDELSTDWMCIDAELLPWGTKASITRRRHLAGMVAALRSLFIEAAKALGDGASVDDGAGHRFAWRSAAIDDCWWPVRTPMDVMLAPFEIVAAEGRAFFDRGPAWHQAMLERLVRRSDRLVATPSIDVDLGSVRSRHAAVVWWERLTARGAEGAVAKPIRPPPSGAASVQRAIKCRGREYLRLVYGLDYDEPEALADHRTRDLRTRNRLSLAAQSLGVAAVEKFIDGEPPDQTRRVLAAALAVDAIAADARL